jgi:hypothetical protein
MFRTHGMIARAKVEGGILASGDRACGRAARSRAG